MKITVGLGWEWIFKGNGGDNTFAVYVHQKKTSPLPTQTPKGRDREQTTASSKNMHLLNLADTTSTNVLFDDIWGKKCMINTITLFHVMIMNVYTTVCQVNRYTISYHHIYGDFINIQGYNDYLFCTLKEFYQNIRKSRNKDDSNAKNLKLQDIFDMVPQSTNFAHTVFKKVPEVDENTTKIESFWYIWSWIRQDKRKPYENLHQSPIIMIIGYQFDQKKLHSTEVYLSPDSPMHYEPQTHQSISEERIEKIF